MGPIITLVQEFNDAWDSGDAGRFRAVAQRVFAPDAIVVRPETAPLRVRELLPVWISEAEAWQPQRHVMVNWMEGEGGAAYEWEWTATHSGLLLTTDGRELRPTGLTVRTRAAGIVRFNGEQITSLEGLFSTHSDAMRQIERAQPSR